jgi:hypothetical protein
MVSVRLLLMGALALAPACAGITAESPLTVALGQSRAAAEASLRAHQYCHVENPPERREVYPRCDRPGVEYGDSWVVGTYDGDRLTELRRWERFDDDAGAMARWNQLVADRARLAVGRAVSREATEAMLRRAPLPAGTRSSAVFRVDGATVVGVYLLTPTAPEHAAVLELVVALPR